MSTTHLFADGEGSFTLRDVKRIPEGLRRPVVDCLVGFQVDVAKLGPEADGPDADSFVPSAILTAADTLNDLLAVAMVESWTLDLPVSVESLLLLESGQYASIREATAPFINDLLPDFSPTPVDGTPTTP